MYHNLKICMIVLITKMIQTKEEPRLKVFFVVISVRKSKIDCLPIRKQYFEIWIISTQRYDKLNETLKFDLFFG